jgi:hypothetical protein
LICPGQPGLILKTGFFACSDREMRKLSLLAKDSLLELLGSEKFNNKSSAKIIFDDSFSINREGISSLINFVKSIKDKGISVVMEGLSYNYVRFFEMAGINKIADLVDEKTDE